MSAAFAKEARARWDALSGKPFSRLLRHCINRIFYAGEGAEDGEVNFGIGAMLGVLALPGVFISLALSEKYGSLFVFFRGARHFDPYVASLPDEYFFIVLSMVVAGSVALWKWDRLLPDRRDYANLAHLPIRSRSIFFANLLALLFLAALLSIDINAASSVLFPLLVCASNEAFSYTAIFFGSHLLAVVLAAAFGFLAVLAVLAILMAVLPYRAFRKSSLYVRSALLIYFVALLTTAFSEPRKIEELQYGASAWIKFPPPAWFAVLCQSLRGLGNPVFSSLGAAAIVGSICSLLLAVGAYALSYRRCFLRSAETIIALPAGGGVFAKFGFRLLDKLVLRSPVQRAGCRFVFKTLFRSEVHSLAWIGFTGAGVITATQTVFAATAKSAPAAAIPSADLLAAPLMLTYCSLVGLRVAFEIPGPLRANWIFRLGVDPGTPQCTALAKRIMIIFEMPLLVGCFAVCAHFWGWGIAMVHTAIVAAMALLLIETLLLRFRKIPFTCTAPPFKETTIVSLIIFILGFYGFSGIIPALERPAFDGTFPYAELIVILLLTWTAILYASRKNQTEPERRLIFDDTLPPAVETMDLTFRR